MKTFVAAAVARRVATIGGASAVLAALAACSPTVSLQPADDATEPGCAEIIVGPTRELSGGDGVGQLRRETDAQGTAAWRTPATVLLRCGVDDPAASPYCVDVSGSTVLLDLGPSIAARPASGDRRCESLADR